MNLLEQTVELINNLKEHVIKLTQELEYHQKQMAKFNGIDINQMLFQFPIFDRDARRFHNLKAGLEALKKDYDRTCSSELAFTELTERIDKLLEETNNA